MFAHRTSARRAGSPGSGGDNDSSAERHARQREPGASRSHAGMGNSNRDVNSHVSADTQPSPTLVMPQNPQDVRGHACEADTTGDIVIGILGTSIGGSSGAAHEQTSKRAAWWHGRKICEEAVTEESHADRQSRCRRDREEQRWSELVGQEDRQEGEGRSSCPTT
jgi:hypothetical protein